MSLTTATPGQLGTQAPAFSLLGVDDQIWSLKSFAGSKVLVIVFMCNHCPYVIAVQERMNRLARDFSSRGVRWVGINSNDAVEYPEDSFEAMKIRARKQSFVFPYLQDSTQEVARAYGAVCTPEFYAYRNDSSGFVLEYKGRLDDHWKDEKQVSRKDLSLALEAILLGQHPHSDQKPSIGCSIKWK